MKYRKKPVIIEAFLWTGDKYQTEDPVWIVEKIKSGEVWFDTDNTAHNNTNMKITTLEGVMTAQRGDYIIQGVQGEIYPCKPDIFKHTYEKVLK
jgi:hypothetical protein